VGAATHARDLIARLLQLRCNIDVFRMNASFGFVQCSEVGYNDGLRNAAPGAAVAPILCTFNFEYRRNR